MRFLNFTEDESLWANHDLFAPFVRNLARFNPEICDSQSAKIALIENYYLLEKTTLQPAEVTLIKNEIDEGVSIVKSDFPDLNVDVYVFEISDEDEFTVKAMNGVTGYSNSKSELLVGINRNSKWQSHVKYTMIHELNHCIRYKVSDPYSRFTDWLILEGLAEVYLSQKFGLISPWAEAVTKTEMLKHLPHIKEWWNIVGMIPNAHEWFFGSQGKSIPQWLGYSLGFWIVDEYLKGNKGISWQNILSLDTDVFINNFFKSHTF